MYYSLLIWIHRISVDSPKTFAELLGNGNVSRSVNIILSLFVEDLSYPFWLLLWFLGAYQRLLRRNQMDFQMLSVCIIRLSSVYWWKIVEHNSLFTIVHWLKIWKCQTTTADSFGWKWDIAISNLQLDCTVSQSTTATAIKLCVFFNIQYSGLSCDSVSLRVEFWRDTIGYSDYWKPVWRQKNYCCCGWIGKIF